MTKRDGTSFQRRISQLFRAQIAAQETAADLLHTVRRKSRPAPDK